MNETAPPIDGSALLDGLVDAVRKTVAERSRWPDSTYRLQFQPEKLSFRDAAAIAPYLAQLGVSHLYASPYFKSQTGSTHGYDVVDHGSLNPGLGSADDYAAMVASLRMEGLGQILDIVPNHMGIVGAENALWNDVLENGPSSSYAHFFDINWHPIKAELENKVLLPLLEDQYGKVLEAGKLQLAYSDGAFFLLYYETKLPLDPRSYTAILTSQLAELKEQLGPESADLRELESILTALDYLPQHTETAAERIAERHREKDVIKGRLKRLTAGSPAISAFIEQNLRNWNGSADNPRSFDRLDELLNAQVYRLSHWKAAADEINYRRFFDVSQLAAVCTEQPEVFEVIHRLVFELVGRGDVDGLRVDHIDGLYDPQDYLRRLQRGYLRTLGRRAFDRIGGSQVASSIPPNASDSSASSGIAPPLKWEDIEQTFLARTEAGTAEPRLPLYVVVEKILGPEEPLPEDWPVAGTTGYDALNHITRLLIDPAGVAQMEKLYQRFINDRTDFREVAYESKLLIARVAMASDIQLLTSQLNRISERHRRSRDFTLNTLRVALREILACFPVYRTYIHQGCVSERDRQVVYRAVAQAKRRRPELDIDLFDFIRDVLLLEQPPDLDEAGVRERALFVGRFQQVTSPLIAKGIEDTAFYIYIPLVSLNEVGGDPTKVAISADEFHRENADRLKRQPGSLIATTTHDTKRTEDTRARINVLSEVPHLWRSAVNHWARLNRRHRGEVDGEPAPSRNDEYLFYQTVVGTWPIDANDKAALAQYPARIQAYMEKATHEAKQRTGWINPKVEYDTAVRDFIAAALANHPRNRFLAELREFHSRIIDWGLYSALSQVFFKLTSPGVPDIYQGEELWDFSLVDPDNRRPVDFQRRRELLSRMQVELAHSGNSQLELARRLADDPRDPNLKLFVTWQLLQFRRQHHDLFRHGQYVPLLAQGSRAEHVCAYAWRWSPGASQAEQIAIAIAPRLLAKLSMSLPEGQAHSGPPIGEPFWSDTHLPLGEFPAAGLKNLFTSETCTLEPSSVRLAAALANFPVALLVNVD
jgi:(1->4)-alpha-D-glucan 1-alpha-D-glucosylmutase